MGRKRTGSSGAMWYAILAAWGSGTLLLAWRFAPHMGAFPGSAVLLFLLACLSYFVLTGVFNVVVNITSRVIKDPPAGTGPRGRPRVAILYCTYNDFDRESAATLLDLRYPALEIWMLDDSTRPDVRASVDAFARSARASGASIRVERRETRKGFKAGAINRALSRLPPEIEYVVIADADERLAPDFVEGCLRHFTDDQVAFVQANHRCYNTTGNWFTRFLGVGVDLHWRLYQGYRNRFGTVNMLGHGALVRRAILERLGGFPEVTCEDLAFTVTAKMAGYRGVFAPEVMCGETFPEDFAAMRRRHLRWSWATVEFLRTNLLPLLRSRVRLHEKLDLVLPSVNLPAVFLLVAFLATTQGSQWLGVSLAAFRDPVVMALGAFASLAPLTMFAGLLRRPWFAAKAIAVNTVAYVALFPVSIVGVLRGLARPAEFLVTPKGAEGPLRLRTAAQAARVELITGGVLLVLGYAPFGIYGLISPLALCALLSPVLMAASRTSLLRQRALDVRPAPAMEIPG